MRLPTWVHSVFAGAAPTPATLWLWTAIFVCLSLLFAVAEAAARVFPEARLHALQEQDDRLGVLARRLLEAGARWRSRLLASAILWHSIAAVLLWHSTRAVSSSATAWLAVVLFALVQAVAVSLVTAIARAGSERVLLYVLPWVGPLELLLAPLAWPVRLAEAWGQRLASDRRQQASADLQDLELECAIEQWLDAGAISAEQASLLEGVVDFKNTVARSVMVPRGQVAALDLDADIDSILQVIVEHGFSRYPVYRKKI
ncbi:MAG: CNNM domain-containing protein, partial [Polyangiales bacterium]